MLNWVASIGRLGFVIGLLAFLRQRWKVAAVCLATAMLAEYLHTEFVDHVRLLASMREGSSLAGYLSVAFVLKNVVVVGSIVAYITFEVWLARHGKVDAGEHTNGWLARAARLSHVKRRDATAPDLGDSRAKSDTARNYTDEQPDGQQQPAETSSADDGFDFLRDGRGLRTHAEKLMRSE